MRNIQKLRLANEVFPCPDFNGLKIKVRIERFDTTSSFVRLKFKKNTSIRLLEVKSHINLWMHCICACVNIPKETIFFVYD